jgi:hypothetical protein
MFVIELKVAAIKPAPGRNTVHLNALFDLNQVGTSGE